MVKRSAFAGVALFAALVGHASAAGQAGEGLQIAGPGVATEDGEISFALAAGAADTRSDAMQVQVQLIYEHCMNRVLGGASLNPGQAIKGPLEQKVVRPCSNDTGVAEWAVTVSSASRVIGTCKVGYARYWDDGARWIVEGRHGEGPYCPLTIRATCNADGDNCLGQTVTGTGPVRVEFSSRDMESATGRVSLPLDRATISPFEGSTR